jgi:hypothetical protein
MKLCNLEDLRAWLEAEAGVIVPDVFRRVILEVKLVQSRPGP